MGTVGGWPGLEASSTEASGERSGRVQGVHRKRAPPPQCSRHGVGDQKSVKSTNEKRPEEGEKNPEAQEERAEKWPHCHLPQRSRKIRTANSPLGW